MKTLANLTIILISLLTMQQSFAQDWPNLNRFQEENEQLMSEEKDSSRIVFMGNSITEGWKTIRPEFFENPSFVNRGISGQTTPQMLLRFRQDVIDLKADVVVILAGINDIAGNTGPMTLEMTVNNIKSMVDLARQNNIKVLLCSVLPAADFNWKPNMQPAKKVVKLNKKLKILANGSTIFYVDYFSETTDGNDGLKPEYGEDGVHPNAKGYAIMEPILMKALNQVLTDE